MRVGIPYAPVQHPGSRNYGYFNLKLHPEDIEKIPEIRSVPELRDVIVMLNGPDSLFQTLGCDKSLAPSDNPQYKRRMNSYFNVVFDVLNWNLYIKNFEGLYSKFEEFAGSKGDLPNSYGVQFEIGTAIFNEHDGLTGLHVAIWNFGYGNNDTDARREWAKGLVIVHEFFKREIIANPKQLSNPQKTGSLG
jgi:hypothetical protein